MVKKKKKAKKGLSKVFMKKVKKKGKPIVHKARTKKVAIRKIGKTVVRKRTIKKVVRKPSKAKEEKFVVGFEEVVVKCPSCGRAFRVVKSSGFSMEGMLCQRCAAGGGGGLGEKEF